jgi:hypothetical protein
LLAIHLIEHPVDEVAQGVKHEVPVVNWLLGVWTKLGSVVKEEENEVENDEGEASSGNLQIKNE